MSGSRIEHAPALRDSVYEELLRMIVGGELRSGDRLVELEFAGQLGVSRGPIREAFLRLKAEGFVDLLPRHGAVVHTPRLDEVEDVFDVRRALEGEAARLAAQRANPESAAALLEIVEEGLTAVDRGESVPGDGQDFHRSLLELSESELLRAMLVTLSTRIRWYSLWFDPVHRGQAWRDHLAIAKAIASGDDATAQDAAIRHVELSREHFRRQAVSSRGGVRFVALR